MLLAETGWRRPCHDWGPLPDRSGRDKANMWVWEPIKASKVSGANGTDMLSLSW